MRVDLVLDRLFELRQLLLEQVQLRLHLRTHQVGVQPRPQPIAQLLTALLQVVVLVHELAQDLYFRGRRRPVRRLLALAVVGDQTGIQSVALVAQQFALGIGLDGHRIDDADDMPGLVRISFGMYNTTAEVDGVVQALRSIARGDTAGQYVQDVKSGEYHALNWRPNLAQYFKL